MRRIYLEEKTYNGAKAAVRGRALVQLNCSDTAEVSVARYCLQRDVNRDFFCHPRHVVN